MQQVPYKIIINTDSYTGNFYRELISYCFGRLSRDGTGFTAYTRSFWDNVVGTGVETYENYLRIREKEDSNKKIIIDKDFRKQKLIASGISEEEAEKKLQEIADRVQQRINDVDILRVYNEFLCFTMQTVDDWEESTFFNIFSYDGDRYSAVYVQLNKPLNNYFEGIIIPRIIKFFSLDIYNRIRDYECLCSYDEINRPHSKPIVLKDLLLVDENDNVIKNYLT